MSLSLKDFRLLWLAVLTGLAACAGTRPAPTTPGGTPLAAPRPHRFFWQANRYDRQHEQHGCWRTYYDSLNLRPFTRGRYHHGRAVGRWRYYAPTGALDRTERHHRGGLSTLTYYHPNGQVARRGQARVVEEPTGLHFFWFGPWLSFDEQGVPLKTEYYENGRRVQTRRTERL